MNYEAILRSAGLGVVIGLCGVVINFSPGSAAWEENIGLSLLFELRGHRPPPSQVVIVSINGETAEQLGLGEEIPHWPRSIHARLIDRLKEAEAAVIAFDIFFKKARPPGSNESMVRAIRGAGNVLLVAYLQQQRILDGQTHVDIERLIPPTEQLAEAALGIAPFVLPKIPVRVSRFWTFTGENRLMSLPAAALQLAADPDGSRLQNLLLSIGEQPSLSGDWQSQLHTAREIFNDSSLQTRLQEAFAAGEPASLTPPQRSLLRSLLALYAGHAYPYINFYGPPWNHTDDSD
ncbi:MAG: hypothetical protein B6D82_04070 [gamma proteobacterium symbiont of Ctena orbiculata]|nr:MAG: hypothetical protein B6D82_04070 [gamma proteobacterium symbiont of Ctena orbiculata]